MGPMTAMIDETPMVFDDSIKVIEDLINAPVGEGPRPSAEHLLMCRAPKDPNDYYTLCLICGR